MSSMPQQGYNGHETFPWKHIIGYIASLVLTAAALWIVMSHDLPVKTVLVAIVTLALFQVFVQLFMFMHVTEAIEQTRFHALIFTMGLFFTVIVVAGSIWAMTWNALYVS